MNQEKVLLRFVNRVRTAIGGEAITQLSAGIQCAPQDCIVARSLNDLDPSVLVYHESIFCNCYAFAKIVADNFGYHYDIIEEDDSIGICQYIVPIPYKIKSFIADFDDGLYPHLVATEA